MIEYNGKKFLISEILHDAADIFLALKCSDKAPAYDLYWRRYSFNTPIQYKKTKYKKERYSCLAVEAAVAYKFGLPRYANEAKILTKNIKAGLKKMGCPVDSSYAYVKHGDDQLYMNPKVQGMRYMWLKLAAIVAEEQGV